MDIDEKLIVRFDDGTKQSYRDMEKFLKSSAPESARRLGHFTFIAVDEMLYEQHAGLLQYSNAGVPRYAYFESIDARDRFLEDFAVYQLSK